jgi:hypothetical protein
MGRALKDEVSQKTCQDVILFLISLSIVERVPEGRER